MLREIVEKPVEACYMAPDKKTALEGTIDLARSLLLGAAVRGQTFYMTDDQSRKIYAFDVTSGGNLANGTCVGAKGQYGVMQFFASVFSSGVMVLYGSFNDTEYTFSLLL